MTDSLRQHNPLWLLATYNLLLASVLYLLFSQPLRQWLKWNEWDWESPGDHRLTYTLCLSHCAKLHHAAVSVALVNLGVMYVSLGNLGTFSAPHVSLKLMKAVWQNSLCMFFFKVILLLFGEGCVVVWLCVCSCGWPLQRMFVIVLFF